MREIKFRGWDTHHRCMITEGGIAELTTGDIVDAARILNRPLMQYTGLKDKRGKEIWEGDIVRESHGFDEYLIGTVYYTTDAADTTPTIFDAVWTARDQDGDRMILRNCEVVGNIHENPELLERGAA